MATIHVPAQLPPEAIERLESILRNNRSAIIGPDANGNIEIFEVRSKPQEMAAALSFSAGFEMEEEETFEPAEILEHEINIEIH